jgi:hypothetical protein
MLSGWPQTAFSSDSHHVPSWDMTQLSSSLCLWSPGRSQGQVQQCRAGILAIACHAPDPLLYCCLIFPSSSCRLRKLRRQWEHSLPRQLSPACCPRQELLGLHALDNLLPVRCCLIHAWPMASPATWRHCFSSSTWLSVKWRMVKDMSDEARVSGRVKKRGCLTWRIVATCPSNAPCWQNHLQNRSTGLFRRYWKP